jgi:amino-acid N-acetyltransferase
MTDVEMTERSFHLRPARDVDRHAVFELIEYFVAQRSVLPRTLDELDELIPNAFVVLDGERVVGFAALEIYSKKLAEIRSLVVAVDMQGRGVGGMLVRACIERARENNIFEVMAISSSESFFLSCGFDYTLPGEKKAFFLQTRPHH